MRNAALLARATLCLVALYLQGSWRLYFSPARWDTFPDSRAFAATIMALVMLLYAVDTLVSEHPVSVLWVTLLFMVGASTIVLLVRHDMPFAAAIYGVTLVALVPAIPLDWVRFHMVAEYRQRSGVVLGWAAVAWQAWFVLTVLRLVISKTMQPGPGNGK